MVGAIPDLTQQIYKCISFFLFFFFFSDSRFVDNWSGIYTQENAPKVPHGGSAVGMPYQNYFAIYICFGLFVPLVIVQMLRNSFQPTPERQKSVLFNVWQIASSLLPFAALIIGAHIAWDIKNIHDYPYGSQEQYYQYSLKVIGSIPSGLNFFHSPKLRWNFFQLLLDGTLTHPLWLWNDSILMVDSYVSGSDSSGAGCFHGELLGGPSYRIAEERTALFECQPGAICKRYYLH